MDRSHERQEHGKKLLHPSALLGLDVIREDLELLNPQWSSFLVEAVKWDGSCIPHMTPRCQKQRFHRPFWQITVWSWRLLVELAWQWPVRRVLPNLSASSMWSPSGFLVTYLVLIFWSSSVESRRAWTALWRFGCLRVLSRCSEVLHVLSSLSSIQDELQDTSFFENCCPAQLLCESRGCFQGHWPSETRGSLILQPSGCEQDFTLSSASSLVFPLPARPFTLLNPPPTHSFFLPALGRNN